MFLTPNDSNFFYRKAIFLSTNKLHELDDYWENNSSHPTHEQIHQMIENALIQRGEKTLKQEKLNLIKNLEKSFLISNTMGRFSANIIGFITKILISINFIKIN